MPSENRRSSDPSAWKATRETAVRHGSDNRYRRPADYQGGVYLGGAEQIFIEKPWLIDGVEVISNTPLS